MFKDRVLFAFEDHSRLSIEIQFSFQGRLLQVLHCKEGRDISIGEEGCDFFVPASVLGCVARPLVHSSAHGLFFCFSEEAQGRAKLYEGQELSLETLNEENTLKLLCTIPHKIFSLSLKEIQWARLVLPNGMQFIVRAVAAPKKPQRKTSFDFAFAGYMGGTVAISSLVLACIFCVDPQIRSLDTDSLQKKNPTVMVQAFEIEAPRVPGFVGDTALQLDLPPVDGVGLNAEPGTQGKKNTPRKRQKFAIAGEVETIKLANHKIEDFSSEVGVLSVIAGKQKGAPFTSVFGDVAVGKDSEDILGGLYGTLGESGGDMDGGHGLCLCGGAQFVKMTGEPTVKKLFASEDKITASGLEVDIVRRLVRRAMPGISFCYEQQFMDEKPSGKVELHFVVSPNGAVSSTEGVESFDKELEDCVLRRISQLAFPAPKNSSVAEVNYSFLFQSPKQ